MKKKILIIGGIIFIAFLAVLGILFAEGTLWFVYPDKKIYQVHGLDISHHQGTINWDTVDAKYQFIFAKASEGDTFVDRKFLEHVSEIKRTGRILGAYHFFHFNYDGTMQAENYIRTAGRQIDLPPVVDFEFSGNPAGHEKETLIRELRKCISRLEEYYGHAAIIYTTPTAYKKIIKDNFDNPLWYRSIFRPVQKNMKNLRFWQYHNSAIIEGIDTKVDLNVFKGNLEDLRSMLMN